MNKLQIFVIFTVFLQTFSQTDCFSNKSKNTGPTGPLKRSVSNPVKDFQTGSHILLNSNSSLSSRYNCFNISLLYINPKNDYDVVASLKSIQSYSDKAGFDFSIRFAKRQSIIQGVFIISQTSVWSTVQIHYILSAREDFRVGTFIADTVELLPCGSQSGNTTVYYSLMRAWNASTKSIFVIPFLSGIKTFDPELNVIFSVATFQTSSNLLTIPFRTDQASNPIQFLYLSYVIVTMDSDFQITNMYDLSYIPSDVNIFIGMTAVQTAPQTTGTPGILKSGIQTLNKTKFEKFFNVQGIVIQTQQNLDLLFSNGVQGSEKVIQCISKERCAGYDGYMVYTQNQNVAIHSECVLCQKFSSYDQTTNTCQCRNSYVRVNGSCVPKSKFCNGSNESFNTLTNLCQCKSNYKRQNQTCVSTCPSGSFFFNSKCYKLTFTSGSSNINSETAKDNNSKSHVACNGGQIWNDAQKQCQCPLINQYFDNSTLKCTQCAQNEAFDDANKKCICESGSFRIKGKCTYCSISGYFDGQECKCLKGFIGNGIICRADPNFVIQGLGFTSQNINIVTQNKVQSEQKQNVAYPPPPLFQNSSLMLQSNISSNSTNNSSNFTPIVIGSITLD